MPAIALYVSALAPVLAAGLTGPIETRVLALQDEVGPTGFAYEVFSDSAPPTMSESGDVFVSTVLLSSPSRTRAFLRVTPDRVQDVVLTFGDALDGGGTVGGGSPVRGSFTRNPVMAADGRVLFATAIVGVPISENSGVFLLDPDTGNTTEVARENDQFPLPFDGLTGELNGFSEAVMPYCVDAGGTMVFSDGISRVGSSGIDALLRASPGGIEALYTRGEPIPAVPGDTPTTAFGFGRVDVNLAGTAVLRVTGTSNPNAIVRSEGSDIDFVLRTNQRLPATGCAIGDVLSLTSSAPAINDSGQIAAHISIDAANNGDTGCPQFLDGAYLLRIEPSGDFEVLARNGGPLPGTDATIRFIQTNLTTLNNAGQVATRITDSDSRVTLVLLDGQTTTVISRQGEPAPGGFEYGTAIRSFALNDAGQVAFIATVNPDPATVSGQLNALFLFTPGHGTRLIARVGDTIDGREITGLTLAGSENDGGDRRADSDGINNAGLIAFQFNTADGGSGVAIAGTTLPALPCNAADLVSTFGVLDLADIDAFIAGFTLSQPIADVAEPTGVFDLADIDTFIAGFLAGCP